MRSMNKRVKDQNLTFSIVVEQDGNGFFAECRESGVGTSTMATGGATRDDGNTIVIKLTGEATTTDDISQKGMLVEYM